MTLGSSLALNIVLHFLPGCVRLCHNLLFVTVVPSLLATAFATRINGAKK